MRVVKGEVMSSKPISLSEAAATISRFAASESGALPDVAACLKRSVAAFKELVHVHRRIRKEGGIKDEDDSVLMKKKERKRSLYEEEMDGSRDLVSESLNIGRKKKRHLDDANGEVKKRRRIVEDDSRLNEKKRKKKKRSFIEGEMEGSSKKVEALCSEKKVEERKKRRNFDAEEGGVNGEVKKHEGKFIDVKVEAFDYEKTSEERRNLVSESLNIERNKRRNSDAQEGEVSGEMKKHEGKKKKRRRIIE